MYVYPTCYQGYQGNANNYGANWIWAIVIVILVLFFLFPGYRNIGN